MTTTDPIELAPGTLAHIIPGEPFATRPALRLDSLALCLPADDAQLAQPAESQLATTVGSHEWLWNAAEYWRFDRTSSQLLRIVAALPPDNAPELEPELEAWTAAPATTGTIALATPQDFTRPEGATRWIDAAGTTLFLRYERPEPSPRPQNRRRVRLADGCFLLIEHDRLAGWQLDRPARFITGDSSNTPLPSPEVEAELGRLLSILITLTDDALLNALDDGDLTVREGLQNLDQRLEPYCARHDPRALEMRKLTRQVLADFGPQPEN